MDYFTFAQKYLMQMHLLAVCVMPLWGGREVGLACYSQYLAALPGAALNICTDFRRAIHPKPMGQPQHFSPRASSLRGSPMAWELGGAGEQAGPLCFGAAGVRAGSWNLGYRQQPWAKEPVGSSPEQGFVLGGDPGRYMGRLNSSKKSVNHWQRQPPSGASD